MLIFELRRVLLLLPLTLFVCSAMVAFNYRWHDQQRIAELVLLLLMAPLCCVLPLARLNRRASVCLLAILGLGVVSACFAAWPWWAFREWACYAGLIVLALLIAAQARHRHFVVAIASLIALVTAINDVQFLARYVSAFVSGRLDLQAHLLIDGFSNIRFLGQFQVLAMPLLAGMVWRFWQPHKRLAYSLLAVLSLQWCIALMLGGRGMFAGLAMAHLALMCFAPRHWRLTTCQLLAAVIGGMVFSLLFVALPYWFDVPAGIHATLRDGLSGRAVIWQLAWRLFLSHPWLGIGPMQFSAHINAVAAHPHQVILQWLAEWGLIATLLAVALASWGMWHGLKQLRTPQGKPQPLSAGLWVSLAAALVLAQVDGVFVMPYTQVWLAVIAGLALACWRTPAFVVHPQQADMASSSAQFASWQKAIFISLSLAVFAIVLQTLIVQVPHLQQLEQSSKHSYSANNKPRFWAQGWIPMAPIRIKSTKDTHKFPISEITGHAAS